MSCPAVRCLDQVYPEMRRGHSGAVAGWPPMSLRPDPVLVGPSPIGRPRRSPPLSGRVSPATCRHHHRRRCRGCSRCSPASRARIGLRLGLGRSRRAPTRQRVRRATSAIQCRGAAHSTTSSAKRSTARPVGHLTQLLAEVRVLRPTAPWEQDSPRGTVSQPPSPETPAGMPSGRPWSSGLRSACTTA